MQSQSSNPEVVVSSFAFKTGAPEANLILDVRFLPDPRPLMEEIPSLDGTHGAVEDFIRSRSCFDQFFEVLKGQIKTVVADLHGRGCHRIEFAFGCTGGQHRSVFVAECLATWLRQNGFNEKVYVHHRELSPRSSTAFDMTLMDIPPMEFHSPASSSGCNSPASSQSSNSSVPSFKCTYLPDSNAIHIEEDAPTRHSLSTEDVGSMLGSGLDRVKALREKRRKTSLATA
jgi:hypothetical protein